MGFVLKYILLFGFFLPSTQLSSAARLFAGPVEAHVLRVIDGDTFLAEALVWPGHHVRVNVRIRGIDAPEMRSRCDAERQAAFHARDELARLIGDMPVLISNISGDKYYGRVLADVANGNDVSVGAEMLSIGMARKYEGKKRIPFC